jgi:CubicO group peptidase (beta-lactamase class C family)
MRLLSFCLFLLLIALPLRTGESASLEADLDALSEEARKAWDVPGCAVAVVKDDRVVLLRGYGVRQLGKTEAVTPDTIFGIGSLTKALAATALAKLVDEGKVKWDDPVRKHVPFFHLNDPLADREVTLRDLLCHRSGMGGHDLLWHSAPWSLEESVRRVEHLELAQPFRSGFLYSNLGYITLGLAITSASGKPWEEYVRKELFEPLGMTGVHFTRSAVLNSTDHASPHRFDPESGKVAVMDWYNDDKQVRASGSVKASVRDLARWVRFQLNEGMIDGKQIVTRGSLLETHRPQVVMPVPGFLSREAETTQARYGLGWRIRDHHGHVLLEHPGSVDGFRAHIVLAPRRKVGVVVLSNFSDLPTALSYALLDRTLDLPKKDWNALLLNMQRREREAEKRRNEAWQARRQRDTKPSRELEAYIGVYTHPAYGKATITRQDATLRFEWSSFKLTLKHFHFDTWTGHGAERLEGDPIVFTLGPEGEVVRMRFLGMDFKREKC